MYSVALMLAFLSAENENRQLEDLPLADFGRLPERLLLYDCYLGFVDSFIFIHKCSRLFFSVKAVVFI